MTLAIGLTFCFGLVLGFFAGLLWMSRILGHCVTKVLAELNITSVYRGSGPSRD
jgi:hypothetical protein